MAERPNRCLLCEARLHNPVCQLPAPSIVRVSSLAGSTTYAPSATLYNQGDPIHEVFIIRSGQVKLIYEHPDGTEQIVRVAGAGETLGLGAQNDRVARLSAVTRTGTSVCRISMVEIERLIKSDPDFALAWAHLLMEEIGRAREAVFNLGPHPAGVRLARFLVEMVHGTNRARRNGEEPPSVALTHADVAASLSIAQETATRLLRDLEDKEVIRLHRGRIELRDLDRLLALAGYPGSAADIEQKS